MVGLVPRQVSGKPITVEEVLATRRDPNNPYMLDTDEAVGSASFVVAYHLDCGADGCLVATKLFGSISAAQEFFNAKAAQGADVSMFGVVPKHLARSTR